jgi:hypothetical protein
MVSSHLRTTKYSAKNALKMLFATPVITFHLTLDTGEKATYQPIYSNATIRTLALAETILNVLLDMKENSVTLVGNSMVTGIRENLTMSANNACLIPPIPGVWLESVSLFYYILEY